MRNNMSNNIAKVISTSALVIGFVSFVVIKPAYADQYGQYGGPTPNGQISLNKMVQNPNGGGFVDNLGVNDRRFQAGNEITYRLEITNNGNTNFGFVDVTDTLPSYLEFISGPGEFNKGANQLKFRLENLTPGKSETRDIRVRVVAQNQLPSDKGVFCVVNAASLVTHDGKTASDTAQVCIGNQVLGVKAPIKELPATGFGQIGLAAMFAAAIAGGLALRKAKLS